LTDLRQLRTLSAHSGESFLKTLHVSADVPHDLVNTVLELQMHDQMVDFTLQHAALFLQQVQRVLEYRHGPVEILHDGFNQLLRFPDDALLPSGEGGGEILSVVNDLGYRRHSLADQLACFARLVG